MAGLASAVVAVVFNAVHPRAPSRSLNDVGELLRIVGASTVSYLVLLTASLALFTLWLVLASLALFRHAQEVAP